MLTNQIRKQRRERTMIGSLQSKWKKTLKKLDKPSLASMVIALSTIMILSAFCSFIDTEHPRTSKERNLKADGAALPLPVSLPPPSPAASSPLPSAVSPLQSAQPSTQPLAPSSAALPPTQLMFPPAIAGARSPVPQLPLPQFTQQMMQQNGYAPQMFPPAAQLPTFSFSQPMNPLLQQMGQAPPMLPSMTLQQCQRMVQSPQMFPLMQEQLQQCQQMLFMQQQMMQQEYGFASPPMLPSTHAVPLPSTAIPMPAAQLPQASTISPAESDKDDDEDSGDKQSVPSLVDGDDESGESTGLLPKVSQGLSDEALSRLESTLQQATGLGLEEARFNVTLRTEFKVRNEKLSVQVKSLSLVNAWLVAKLAEPYFARVEQHHMRVGKRGGDRWKEANIIRKIKCKLESVLESKYECTCPTRVYERETGTGTFKFVCQRIERKQVKSE